MSDDQANEQLLKALAEQTEMVRKWRNRARVRMRKPRQWLVDVCDEMSRQDDKWGAQRGNPIDVPQRDREILPTEARAKWLVDSRAARGEQVTWSAILLEEICEAYNAPSRPLLREELVQCAAVIGQWIEAIDRSVIEDES